jgi:hypothetical protein
LGGERVHHLRPGSARYQLHAARRDLPLGQLLEQGRITRRLEQTDQNGSLHHLIQLRLSDLAAARALHFENHLRRGVNLLRGIGEIASGRAVGFVSKPGANPGPAFDDYPVPRASELRHDFRNERNAALAARDLSRDANQHSGKRLSVICSHKISAPDCGCLY